MAQRLPVVGSDNNLWGDVLNGFLGVSLNTDGTVKSGIITTNEISSTAGITKAQLASSVQSSLTSADNAVHLSGAETIAGVKTFSSSPVGPTPALIDSSTSLATTAFVQSTAYGSAPDFQTLVNNNANYPTWAQVQVQTTSQQVHSVWFKNYYGQWQPVHGTQIGVYGSGAMSDLIAHGNDLLSVVYNNSSKAYVPTGTKMIDDYNGNVIRWNGGTWKAWESDWIGASTDVGGLYGSKGASPGFIVVGAEYRYMNGMVKFRGEFYLNGSGSGSNGNQMYVTLPVSANNITRNRPSGTAYARNSSDSNREYLIYLSMSPSNLYFGGLVSNGVNTGSTNGVANSTPFNEPWGQSDDLAWDVMYEPA